MTRARRTERMRALVQRTVKSVHNRVFDPGRWFSTTKPPPMRVVRIERTCPFAERVLRGYVPSTKRQEIT